MEQYPNYIVVCEPVDNKFSVHALHVTIDRIPVYVPLRTLRYDTMSDAIRGANEHAKRTGDHTERVIQMANEAMRK